MACINDNDMASSEFDAIYLFSSFVFFLLLLLLFFCVSFRVTEAILVVILFNISKNASNIFSIHTHMIGKLEWNSIQERTCLLIRSISYPVFILVTRMMMTTMFVQNFTQTPHKTIDHRPTNQIISVICWFSCGRTLDNNQFVCLNLSIFTFNFTATLVDKINRV